MRISDWSSDVCSSDLENRMRVHELISERRDDALQAMVLANDAEPDAAAGDPLRSEEHTSELQSLMRISYAVFCLKKKTPLCNDMLITALRYTVLLDRCHISSLPPA